MVAYLINLDKNKKRLLSMEGQLKSLGIAFKRFPAVYGAALTTMELRRCVSSVRAFIARGMMLSCGQIGCALSHIGIYRKMIEGNESLALILEDDLVIKDGFKELIDEVAKFVDVTRPQVVLLSAWNAPQLKNGIVRVKFASCADAYVITLKAAQKIVKYNFPVMTVADDWRRWSRRGGLEIYRAYPTLVCQDNNQFGSDIDMRQATDGVVLGNGTGRKGFDLLLFRGQRLVEKAIDWCLWLATGR